mmetsp:Transcript_32934/g.76943  ORF Transcript_32934/g.76943 Transcript_32934/m.76943 type:complete len:251 (+) Transcript_32934:904-1656(+)
MPLDVCLLALDLHLVERPQSLDVLLGPQRVAFACLQRRDLALDPGTVAWVFRAIHQCLSFCANPINHRLRACLVANEALLPELDVLEASRHHFEQVAVLPERAALLLQLGADAVEMRLEVEATLQHHRVDPADGRGEARRLLLALAQRLFVDGERVVGALLLVREHRQLAARRLHPVLPLLVHRADARLQAALLDQSGQVATVAQKSPEPLLLLLDGRLQSRRRSVGLLLEPLGLRSALAFLVGARVLVS